MNFLAHAFLAGDDPALRVGGLIGDFVKGPLPAGLAPDLAGSELSLLFQHAHLHQLLELGGGPMPLRDAALDLLRRRAREEVLMVHDGAEEVGAHGRRRERGGWKSPTAATGP